jgi:hypothetical protein
MTTSARIFIRSPSGESERAPGPPAIDVTVFGILGFRSGVSVGAFVDLEARPRSAPGLLNLAALLAVAECACPDRSMVASAARPLWVTSTESAWSETSAPPLLKAEFEYRHNRHPDR